MFEMSSGGWCGRRIECLNRGHAGDARQQAMFDHGASGNRGTLILDQNAGQRRGGVV